MYKKRLLHCVVPFLNKFKLKYTKELIKILVPSEAQVSFCRPLRSAQKLLKRYNKYRIKTRMHANYVKRFLLTRVPSAKAAFGGFRRVNNL